MFVADALAAWLVGLLADASRKKLTTLVLGSEQERALRQAATGAVQLTARDLNRVGGGQGGQLAMVLSEVFREPAPGMPLAGRVTLLEALQTGVAGQLAVVDDASLTGTGQSSADVLGVPGTVLAETLTGHLVHEIMLRGSRGGPLATLADQLNHDVTHLQGQRLEGMLARLAGEVRDALARAGAATAETGQQARPEHAELPWEAGPAPTRHNLPAPLTSLLGREEDLGRLERLLEEARLVTLTGTGGTGKTRLAIETATRVMGRFRDGVWLADLAGIADPGLVPSLVMEALGVRQHGDLPVVEALRYRLRAAELLLVLDNCEHLLDACAQLARVLLRGSPGLRVLATSRELLGIAGEVTYPVRPLGLPPELADAQATARAPAVQLFVERGAAARGSVTGGVVPVAVAGRICRELDGLPLAIELAAARMNTLSAAEIETHLGDRFQFLAHRRAATHPHHQALRAALDWSYNLLTADERRVLSELSVFAGTFGLKQAAAVCYGGDQQAALAVIDRLATKSMLTPDPARDRTRYRLLETMRQYAAERLTKAGGAQAARQRHALAFLDLAERERAAAALSREHDNFRAALEWSLTQRDPAGLRLARALGDFWLTRGMLQEGRHWLERALQEPSVDQRLRADLLRLLGMVLFEGGDLEQAEAVLSKGAEAATAAGAAGLRARIGVLSVEIRNLKGGDNVGALQECEHAAAVLEAEGDLAGLAEAWTVIGKLRFWVEDPSAGEVLERAIACGQQSGNHRAQMRASTWLAVTFHALLVPADAGVARTEQLLQQAAGDPWAEADLLKPLMVLYAYVGRAADARAALARSQSIFAGFGAQFALAETGIPAGLTELTLGNPEAAERYLREAYAALRAMGEHNYLGDIAGLLSEALYAQDRLDEAQQMLDEARAVATPDDIDAQVTWETQAKLLARRGKYPAARRLAANAEARLSQSSAPLNWADTLRVKGEVERLAGAPDDAERSLRAALQIYENWRAPALAEQARATLASLTTHPGTKQT